MVGAKIRDAKQAGLEAARSALVKSGRPEADIAFVFATVGYDPNELLAGVNEVVPHAFVHGATSFTGIVTPVGFLGGDADAVGVLMLSSRNIDFGTGYSELGSDPEAAGRLAAEMAVKAAISKADFPADNPSAVLMAASPGNEEAVMRGIAKDSGSGDSYHRGQRGGQYD